MIVSNDKHVPCVGMYRATTFSIDGKVFPTDFFTLPLDRYDIVLST